MDWPFSLKDLSQAVLNELDYRLGQFLVEPGGLKIPLNFKAGFI